jgi:hypothetical protein
LPRKRGKLTLLFVVLIAVASMPVAVRGYTLPDFTLSVSPSSITTRQGGTAGTVATIRSYSDYEIIVDLNIVGLPSHAGFSLSNVVDLMPGGTAYRTLFIYPGSTPAGSYQLTLVGMPRSYGGAPQQDYFTLTVTPSYNPPTPNPNADFDFWVISNSIYIVAGGSDTVKVNVSPFNGFSSGVSLSASGVPEGVYLGWSTMRLDTSNGFATAIVTINVDQSAPPSDSMITFIGQGGGRTHTDILSLSVGVVPTAFDLSLPSTSVSVAAGSSVEFTLAVTSNSDSTMDVSLSQGVSWEGMNMTISPTQVTVSPGATAYSTVAITTDASTPPDTYGMSIAGTGGGNTYTVQFELVVTPQPDFDISVVSNSIQLTRGDTWNADVSVNPIGQFSSNISLTASGNPDGMKLEFSPTQLAPAQGVGTSTVTVTIDPTTATGEYTITITGTPPEGQAHSCTLTVTVTSQ